MQIQFCGANREVTGSCHLLKTDSHQILVDCGMFQGGDFTTGKNFEDFPFDASEIDVLLVTHAHLDHVGRIPKLIKDGFAGPIFCTKGTIEIMQLVLTDAWHIMKYNHRKYQYPMLYSEEDVQEAMSRVQGVDYDAPTEVIDGVTAVWKDAGHIFGSAFIEVEADGKRIGFSGDIGNVNVPILKETASLGEVDVLLIESTYGDRFHDMKKERNEVVLELVKEGCKKGGTIMVPAFSIERTQEILYALNELAEEDETLPKFPIYLDSPMAIDVTKVFKEHPEYYDAEACKKFMAGDDFLDFPQLENTYDTEDSKKINSVPPPKMVIAGAGMMNGGRILHHAIRYLSDEKSTLIIVGYQANGTTGRRLYEGAETVKIWDKRVPVRATVKAIGALSAHGDQKKLINWVKTAPTAPKKIYCVHGEPQPATELAHRMKEQIGVDAYVPEYAEIIDID